MNIDSEVWVCAGCAGTIIGDRTPDDLCRSCLAAALACPRCALCGNPALGYGRGLQGEALCHSSVRDCYHRWTVWGERPDGTRQLRRELGAEHLQNHAVYGGET